jgi:hypothetical protein
LAGPGGGKQALDDCTSSAHPWRPGNLKPTVRKAYTIVLPVCQSGLAVRFSRLAGTGVACRTPLSLSVFFLRRFYDPLAASVVLFCGNGCRQPDGLGSLWLRTALRRKYATILLCLFLFIAAVDTIPDPPAINPPRSHSCAITALHVRGPLTILEDEWLGSSSLPQAHRPVWSPFQLTLDPRPTGISTLPLVHHAADSSPPLFS